MVIVHIIAGAVALVLVIEIARALYSRHTRRRRRAQDLEPRLVDQTPHRSGCACSPECWSRYVDGLDRYPWSRKEDAR